MAKKRQPTLGVNPRDGAPKVAPKDSDGYRTNKIILRGYRLNNLLRELAYANVPQKSLAEKYGVTEGRISQIKTEHWDRILNIREDLDNELAGLWVTDKTNRLAEYQDNLEIIRERLAIVEPGGEESLTLMRHADQQMRRIAEELGQIPNKMTVKQQATVSYNFEDVNDADVT